MFVCLWQYINENLFNVRRIPYRCERLLKLARRDFGFHNSFLAIAQFRSVISDHLYEERVVRVLGVVVTVRVRVVERCTYSV